jgi:phosphonopyruvate decarboxylase
MIAAETFIAAAREAGLAFYTGVPCSYLKPFINYTISDPRLDYVGAANEGDALAIASGAWLGGKPAVVMFQNSGLGNAVNPITSLSQVMRIPALLITTLRGEPGGAPDEPQHALMGAITTSLLDVMGVPWAYFPENDADVPAVLGRAVAHMTETRTPYALVMRKDAVAPYRLTAPASRPRTPAAPLPPAAWPAERPTRQAILEAVQAAAGPTDAIVATTGFTGRELYALDDRPSQLYMVGAMGCAASLGLGLALSRPDRRVIVLDGDGAALMRLSALATIGHEGPANLVHILLDNEVHDSTGGQATVTDTADLAAVAHACGYPDVRRLSTAGDLAAALGAERAGTSFWHIKTSPGTQDGLPRPKVTPDAVVSRFQAWMAT